MIRSIGKKFIFFLVIASFFAAPLLVGAEEKECRIAILKSWDLPEYNTALKGFSEVLDEHAIACQILTFNLHGDEEGISAVAKQIYSFHPTLIVAIGSRATAMAQKHLGDVPIVFSMVLYPVASGFVKSIERPGRNVTGAAIDIPIKYQMQLLLRIVPNLKRVGVLYSPEETEAVVQEAANVARSMGLNLIAEKVSSETDVPETLGRLERQHIQTLWSVADGKVFTPQSTQYIIEETVKKQIPFMGPHSAYVRAGALVALTPSYEDNGRQAGEIAIQVLKGANPATIPVAVPRGAEIALNLRVATHIGVKIPETLIDEASQVFE
jgi:putative ABC transport system substrate-binding protein